MTNIDPQMLKGLLTVLLLSMLDNADDYGYSLVEQLRVAGFSEIAEGTVYPALSRLEHSGLVESYHVASKQGPARKYYRITETGRSEMISRSESWLNLTSLVEPFLKETSR